MNTGITYSGGPPFALKARRIATSHLDCFVPKILKPTRCAGFLFWKKEFCMFDADSSQLRPEAK